MPSLPDNASPIPRPHRSPGKWALLISVWIAGVLVWMLYVGLAMLIIWKLFGG